MMKRWSESVKGQTVSHTSPPPPCCCWISRQMSSTVRVLRKTNSTLTGGVGLETGRDGRWGRVKHSGSQDSSTHQPTARGDELAPDLQQRLCPPHLGCRPKSPPTLRAPDSGPLDAHLMTGGRTGRLSAGASPPEGPPSWPRGGPDTADAGGRKAERPPVGRLASPFRMLMNCGDQARHGGGRAALARRGGGEEGDAAITPWDRERGRARARRGGGGPGCQSAGSQTRAAHSRWWRRPVAPTQTVPTKNRETGRIARAAQWCPRGRLHPRPFFTFALWKGMRKTTTTPCCKPSLALIPEAETS